MAFPNNRIIMLTEPIGIPLKVAAKLIMAIIELTTSGMFCYLLGVSIGAYSSRVTCRENFLTISESNAAGPDCPKPTSGRF